ncbi:hypothetical protein LSH36_443g02000 [Paralvinella palmiformis]|uniref:Uncharacterized protein n=1 Tax=Paralvinella palmiformis TaxID=53620 RepID=A0AAD9MXN5_9ANNE|nr:hypothetical protein LSH36_443g02000 [Paralvinella palmiformis]
MSEGPINRRQVHELILRASSQSYTQWSCTQLTLDYILDNTSMVWVFRPASSRSHQLNFSEFTEDKYPVYEELH